MEQLPKIVLDRMRTEPAGEHPDADLLTGFTERTISERERKEVLSHLGSCKQCRDLMALALPDEETAEAMRVTSSPVSPWRRWVVLRWGAALACVVVVGGAVVIGFRPSRHADRDFSTTTISDKGAPPTAAREEQPVEQRKELAPQSPPAAQQSERIDAVSRAKSLPDAGHKYAAHIVAKDNDSKVASSAAPARNVTAQNTLAEKPGSSVESSGKNILAGRDEIAQLKTPAPAPAGNVPTSDSQSAAEMKRQPASSAITAMSESVTVSGAAPSIQTDAATLAKTKKQENPRGASAGSVTAAANAPRGIMDTAASAPAGYMPDLKTPTWRLSEDGLPQRSFDSGARWEKIQVDHRSGFRALSTYGMEVWVGGNGGLLYHTTDIGLHWGRIVPTVEGHALTADITKIDFTDPLHGTVTTSNGETWLTADSGKTWERK